MEETSLKICERVMILESNFPILVVGFEQRLITSHNPGSTRYLDYGWLWNILNIKKKFVLTFQI